MLDYSQRNGLWARQTLGKSKLTMGRFGCVATCIADLSTYFGGNFNPGDLAAVDIFTPEGLVIWAKCEFWHFHFQQRMYARDDFLIKQAILDPNLAVILNVAYGSHWVVATGLKSLAGVYAISDPWFGDRVDMRRYEDEINGFAVFRRK